MSDPLTEVVQLLRPQAVFANPISGKGSWAVRFSEFGLPSFCIMLEGECQLAVDGQPAITICAGDFVLLPATPAFTLSSFTPSPPVYLDPNSVANRHSELRYGESAGAADMRSLGGSFLFDSPNPGLLVSLLPAVVHVRQSTRIAQLMQMVGEETRERKPGNDFVLSRLVELLLVEALRSAPAGHAPPSLLQGLNDERLAPVLTQLHADITKPWTTAQLAKIAALSRSAFFERFNRIVGTAPMTYLLHWRMEIAKSLIRHRELSIAEIATRVGYGSSSAFSVAFSKHVGQAPSKYADV